MPPYGILQKCFAQGYTTIDEAVKKLLKPSTISDPRHKKKNTNKSFVQNDIHQLNIYIIV